MTDLISALRLLTRLKSKSVHLGVTGSVACYKAIELMRALLHAGMRVSATLTPAAREFVTPLLFESLGAFPVYSDLFRDGDVFAHLEPGQNADAFFVVPASANTLAKMAQGLAMDMLSARKKWYQHVDETTGEYVADDSDDARQHLAAFQKVEQKILKLAGV